MEAFAIEPAMRRIKLSTEEKSALEQRIRRKAATFTAVLAVISPCLIFFCFNVISFAIALLEPKCDDVKVWADCAHKCPLTCADIMNEGKACVTDEDCKPG